MAQAKTLNKQELKRVLDYNDACERHSERNRAMLLFTHLCGMRIGEVVALRVGDVIDDNDEVLSFALLDDAVAELRSLGVKRVELHI